MSETTSQPTELATELRLLLRQASERLRRSLDRMSKQQRNFGHYPVRSGAPDHLFQLLASDTIKKVS